MSRKQYALLVVAAVLAGLLGGVLSNRLLVATPAFAQGTAKPAKIVTAEEIRITDKDGNLRATLGLAEASTAMTSIQTGKATWKATKTPSPALTLLDSSGRQRLVLGLADNQPHLALHPDKKGQPGAVLTLAGFGPALLLENETGKTRMLLAATDQGPKLYVADENGIREVSWATKIRLLDLSGPPE